MERPRDPYIGVCGTHPNTDDLFSQLAPLKRYALSLTRDRSDAEDLVHDTLVKAIEKERQFQPGRNARAWLFSILHNTFVDKRRARRCAPVSRPNGPPTSTSPCLPRRRLRCACRTCAGLSFACRRTSARRSISCDRGLPYEEAAAALAIPVGTLVSRVSRARAQLRAMDEDDGSNVLPFKARGGSDDAAS